jgi:uncharacterized alpha-E superfamily protein
MKRRPTGLISRVADCCLWFGRYLERAESTARQLQATQSLARDGELAPRQCWYPLVVVAGEEAGLRARAGDGAFSDGEAVQQALVWDDACAVSLRRTVAAARENARSIRDVVSGDAWVVVNELHLWLEGESARAMWSAHRDGFYRHVRASTQLCLGLLRSTMLHDTALDFIWLGVLVERVGQTARLLDVHHVAFAEDPTHQVVETALWLALLRACSGVEPFMKAYAGRVSGAAVARFLLLEEAFPRSVAYCVRSAYERLCAIRPASEPELPGGLSLERLRTLDAWVRELSEETAHEPAAMHAALTHIVDETAAICDTIGSELLGYGPPATASHSTPPPADA